MGFEAFIKKKNPSFCELGLQKKLFFSFLENFAHVKFNIDFLYRVNSFRKIMKLIGIDLVSCTMK